MYATAADPVVPGTAALLRALSAIRAPAREAVWFDRPVNAVIAHYFDTALDAGLSSMRWLSPWRVGEALELDGWLPLPGREAFAADLVRLASALCLLSGRREARIRIEVSTQTTCPRFHVDNVVLRLLCTYRGPGTEYLEGRYADRSRLGPGSDGLPDECSGLIRKAAGIVRIPRFAVAVLKGERWTDGCPQGAIHRSPATSPEAGARIVAAIDIP